LELFITNCDVFTNITQSSQKNRNKTGNITQTKITGIFTTLKFNKSGTKMLERRCALFGCNNSRIGTKITNSEIYKEALKHARRV
jgi:hypothetical protein